MKAILKNLGLLLVAAGVVLLVVYTVAGKAGDNTLLGVAALLLVGGLLGYIVLNRLLD